MHRFTCFYVLFTSLSAKNESGLNVKKRFTRKYGHKVNRTHLKKCNRPCSLLISMMLSGPIERTPIMIMSVAQKIITKP